MVGVRLQLAQAVDDLLGGIVRRDGDEVLGHQSARGLFPVGEQLADVTRLVWLHEPKQLGLALLRQVGQQVGCVVWPHLLEDVGGRLRRQCLEHVDLVLGR